VFRGSLIAEFRWISARASGKPIVATANVGYREVIDEAEGILVPPDDPDVFADAVLRLSKDEASMKEMGKNGRKKSLDYSWDKIIHHLTSYYDEILNRI
jgi:phosphatidylinositol alpha-mannosyltransferase